MEKTNFNESQINGVSSTLDLEFVLGIRDEKNKVNNKI